MNVREELHKAVASNQKVAVRLNNGEIINRSGRSIHSL
ncbi:hypothetical protein SAMN05421578_10245 [Paenibacillus macquariensis]|uniref:Uncharacterized protein n=1 Tax=Paenibacillus macquariensis TaxID=948756 RepID=A0ABY1JM52_9BACL|nr:hypothetical protein SAMN05421578_10245 [Paenibacillus macquariensis]